ncbi:glycoside hydrolase family 43 protein [Ornithinimicrobium pratense]|uniref:Family 43 glycosylhydrolase n=1 Tax=Ornithinimicrobium pratense TaxID=2593973 RepID=A0A5J6V412_9MICO|nr:glycoside hydrolase family 43 protein [Ornithinimicrobium pratense]QFG68700.1 family 43 glycosylhydrolase [Ornithinimicrobium pratense]
MGTPRLVSGVLLLGVLTACSSPTAPGDSAARTAEDAAAISTSPLAGQNPVLNDDFPDPDVLEVDGVYYAYATNGNSQNVRMARSTDLLTWEQLGDALPELPSWVIPGKTWAPEVSAVGDSYVLYFTATNYRPTLQCIGTAVSATPEGPFEVVGDGMLVCPEDEGGAIDAATFLDEDGTRYLLWKNDGNCCGLDTWLYLAPLASDGLSLEGPATRLLKQDQEWEGNLIEAPTLVEREGTYVLLYSANDYGGQDYAVGYATAEDVTGPYVKHPDPLLASTGSAPEYVGPGGQDVVTGPDGQDYVLFHSWRGETTYRAMNVLPLSWEGVPEDQAPGGVNPTVEGLD